MNISGMSPTPDSVQPPTGETVEAYRAAVLAYRAAFAIERRNGMRANPHVPLRAARDAVMAVRPGIEADEAERLAQKACAWAAQAHRNGFWKE